MHYAAASCNLLMNTETERRKTSSECCCCIHGAGESMLESALFVGVLSLETHNYHLREKKKNCSPSINFFFFFCILSPRQQITRWLTIKLQQNKAAHARAPKPTENFDVINDILHTGWKFPL